MCEPILPQSLGAKNSPSKFKILFFTPSPPLSRRHVLFMMVLISLHQDRGGEKVQSKDLISNILILKSISDPS